MIYRCRLALNGGQRLLGRQHVYRFCTKKNVVEKTVVDTSAVVSTVESTYKPGFFSRNPGIVLGAFVGSIAAYLFRGNKNQKAFQKIQDEILKENVLSPYEAYEIRKANVITMKDFVQVLNDLPTRFPNNRATIEAYDQYLGEKLEKVCPKGIVNGYHLERVLLSLPKESNKEVDVQLMTTAFSLAIKGTADERLACLFGMLSPSDTITLSELTTFVENALLTFQIPSEKQVVVKKDISAYPFQQYERASSYRLVEDAIITLTEKEKVPSVEMKEITFEDFSALMKSKNICLWGECYGNKSKKRMKN